MDDIIYMQVTEYSYLSRIAIWDTLTAYDKTMTHKNGTPMLS